MAKGKPSWERVSTAQAMGRGSKFADKREKKQANDGRKLCVLRPGCGA